ncbi:50S ribosomal protein L25/general stress protein Ctc [Ureibacillus composti]
MDIILQAATRAKGKGPTINQLRKQEKLPGVIYGYNIQSTPIVMDYKETAKAVQKLGRTSVFKINIEGNQVNAIINEVQRCALKGHVKHIDFLSINMAEEITVEVPITIVGESIGVKEGGVLTQPIRELTIKVKPSNIPESIEIDVSDIEINGSLSVADFRSKVNFEVLNPDEDTLVTVTPPATASDDTAGQGDDGNQDIKATEAPESEA